MRIKRQGMRRGVSLLPNMLTTANLFCGFFSITKSLQGEFVFAAWMVILATLFDFMDGRVARMTNTQSDFGVEYDSLSDLTTFCMAPAILIYTWSLSDFGKVGIAVTFLFFACGALRLARFNVQAASVEKVNFQGLPTPAAGGTLVSYVIFFDHLFASGRNPSVIVLGMAAVLAFLMVSNVEYLSAKKTNRASFFFMVCAIAAIVVIASQPEIMFFGSGVVYVSLGLIHWLWKSPQKIRNLTDLIQRIYNDRKERFVYDDDDEDENDVQHYENILKINNNPDE